MLKPLFKWTGSKQRMKEQYAPHFFPETVETYVDLFAGGLTNVLWVADRYPEANIILNDANAELIQLYRDLASNVDGVVEAWQECVDKWLDNEDKSFRKKLYYSFRETYCLHWEDKPSPVLSGMLLFMLSVNFNGIWKAYLKCNQRYSTPPGVCTQKEKFFDRDNIFAVASVLKKSTILSGSFEDVVLPDGAFVYADPPYRDCVVEYQGGFTEELQVKLAEKLMNHKGPFAYSNKDIGDGFYDRHFPEANIIPCNATYTAGRGIHTHKVSEVLVTNF